MERGSTPHPGTGPLGRVLEMAESSSDKWEYEAKVAKRFGFEQQLELPIPLAVPVQQEAANGGGLFDLDAPDFEGAAFRTLEGVEFACGAFGLNTEQPKLKLAFWAGQQRFRRRLGLACHPGAFGCSPPTVRLTRSDSESKNNELRSPGSFEAHSALNWGRLPTVLARRARPAATQAYNQS
jgi:hypothetical protein